MSYKITCNNPCLEHPEWPATRCIHCTDYEPTFDVNTPVRSKGSKSAWNYTHQFSDKDRVQIHSRRQFERECDKRNLEHVVRSDLLYNGSAPNRDVGKLNGSDRKAVKELVKKELPQIKKAVSSGALS